MKKGLFAMVLGLVLSFVASTAQAQNFVIVVEQESPTVRSYTFQTDATDGVKPSGDSLDLANKLLAVKGVKWFRMEKNQAMIGFAGVTSKEIDKEMTWTLKRFFNGKNMHVVYYTDHDHCDKEAFRAKLENAIYSQN